MRPSRFLSLGLLLLVLVLATAGRAGAQSRYMTKFGLVTLYSATPVVDIEARNVTAAAIVDLDKGQIAVSVIMKDFQFERSLMQQHFNESYLETDTYPKAIFTGKLLDYQPGSLKPNSKLTAIAEGELSLHGVLKPIRTPVWLELKDGRLVGTTRFVVSPADYKIDIPLIVRDHIAKSVDVQVTLLMDPAQAPPATATKP